MKTIGTICGLLICQLLYWLSDAPYERGWSLWEGMGIGSILFGFTGYAIGMAAHNAKNGGENGF